MSSLAMKPAYPGLGVISLTLARPFDELADDQLGRVLALQPAGLAFGTGGAEQGAQRGCQPSRAEVGGDDPFALGALECSCDRLEVLLTLRERGSRRLWAEQHTVAGAPLN